MWLFLTDAYSVYKWRVGITVVISGKSLQSVVEESHKEALTVIKKKKKRKMNLY